MRYHFADLLDREDDYWTMIPNRERYAYFAAEEIEDKQAVRILTLTKHHKNWQHIFDYPNLEELILTDPGKDQVHAIQKLTQIKRLRITFFRAKDIEFVSSLWNLEELALEYVSGFTDLSPIAKLTKLKSLHLENLRRVSCFEGLKGMNSLRYLSIYGTLDWSQPIDNFAFLEGLPNLEVFWHCFIINKTEFPAFLPILKLKSLKKIQIGRSTFKTREYAFLMSALPGVKGCSWDLCWDYRNKFEFLGKQAGWVNKDSPDVKQRCEKFINEFAKMKTEAQAIIKQHIV